MDRVSGGDSDTDTDVDVFGFDFRFGIRSLSKSDPFYGGGDQYWTGPIWINVNYLIVSSLKKVPLSALTQHL